MTAESTDAALLNQECEWCGLRHTSVCPTIQAIEYFENGKIKRGEFRPNPPYPHYIPMGPWVPDFTIT